MRHLKIGSNIWVKISNIDRKNRIIYLIIDFKKENEIKENDLKKANKNHEDIFSSAMAEAFK
ncbi:30S ribosomal protein S1, partial [Buchnera aphidicola]|nr:30S ribosomal protein S1 [Buchnera aphidicola]